MLRELVLWKSRQEGKGQVGWLLIRVPASSLEVFETKSNKGIYIDKGRERERERNYRPWGERGGNER